MESERKDGEFKRIICYLERLKVATNPSPETADLGTGSSNTHSQRVEDDDDDVEGASRSTNHFKAYQRLSICVAGPLYVPSLKPCALENRPRDLRAHFRSFCRATSKSPVATLS